MHGGGSALLINGQVFIFSAVIFEIELICWFPFFSINIGFFANKMGKVGTNKQLRSYPQNV